MNDKLSKIIIVLFFLVTLTWSSVNGTFARFQCNSRTDAGARTAAFDVELQLPTALSAGRELNFYASSVSKKYHFYVKNNSEVTIKSKLSADNTVFSLVFSEEELYLQPNESKCVEVVIKPKGHKKGTEQVNITVKTEQVD